MLEQAYAELIEPSGIHRIQYSREDLVNLKNQYGHSLLHIACGASEIVSQKDSNQEQDFTLEDKPPIQNILVSRLDVVEFLVKIHPTINKSSLFFALTFFFYVPLSFFLFLSC